MTGRRSHGRLSALNGVVHQGSEIPNDFANFRHTMVICSSVNRLFRVGPPRSARASAWSGRHRTSKREFDWFRNQRADRRAAWR